MAKWKQPAMGTQIKAIRETKVRKLGTKEFATFPEGTKAKLRHVIGNPHRTAGESIVFKFPDDNISFVGDINDWRTIRGVSLDPPAEDDPHLA